LERSRPKRANQPLDLPQNLWHPFILAGLLLWIRCLSPDRDILVLGGFLTPTTGRVQPVAPAWGPEALIPSILVVVAHHIAAGIRHYGIFHMAVLTRRCCTKLYGWEILKRYFPVVHDLLFRCFCCFWHYVVWQCHNPGELFGLTRYQWDDGYFQHEIDRGVQPGWLRVKASRSLVKHPSRWLSTTMLVIAPPRVYSGRSNEQRRWYCPGLVRPSSV